MIQWTSGVGQKKRLRLPVSLGIRLHPKTFESLRLRLRNPASSHQQRDNKTTSQNNMWSLRRFYAQQATCQITRTSGDNWKNETCPPSPPGHHTWNTCDASFMIVRWSLSSSSLLIDDSASFFARDLAKSSYNWSCVEEKRFVTCVAGTAAKHTGERLKWFTAQRSKSATDFRVRRTTQLLSQLSLSHTSRTEVFTAKNEEATFTFDWQLKHQFVNKYYATIRTPWRATDFHNTK